MGTADTPPVRAEDVPVPAEDVPPAAATRTTPTLPAAGPSDGASVTVLGEAVVDLVSEPDGRFTAHPGGSPLNVAVGLARLGVPTALLARFSTARFGRWLRGHAETNGVDVRHAVDTDHPATLAIASLAGDGVAEYDFYVDGTADWQWRAEELAPALTGQGILHTGSLAVFRSPGADRLAAALGTARQRGALVSLDPNIRPGLVGTPDEARDRIDGLVRLAHVVKASEEDVAWLYPDRSIAQVLRHWQDLGVALAVVTLGAGGVVAASGTREFRLPAPVVDVVDTIGAGDSFTAGLLAGLSRAPACWPDEEIAAALRYAVEVAAVTCTRAGADPPYRHDLPAAGRLSS
ncbi:carbohydrate kinase family protein [Micromonospora endophytica]|uniref:Carbohydrate kinase n=1 Tax=Micromonospora endophytica TaxID=515350 RepID=A0A2W2D3F2_9ACTN|nr:carbohydrate kinase [Micromonospora endophytica]PZG00185.1 carbohydrate kinase [Micromonospora endophytica]RIW47973.1 carbohydrate kinase [Micromonospora endophytica]